MSESSGIFTFPSTGIWEIVYNAYTYIDGENRDGAAHIEATTDNSSTWKEEFIPGKFLIFKSDLLHCVNRHELDSKRYSLATNFIIQ